MCFDIFRKKTDYNNIFYIRYMDCFIVISQNFTKPFGIYNDLKLAKEQYDNLTRRHVHASIYKVEINNNIVDNKDFYTLICDNNINSW